MIPTVDGCKQGGILSGYLFNYFIHELIKQCIDLGIGCHIETHNISIIAYCDDLFLMTTTKEDMDLLLELIGEYALNWKMRFNVDKCFNLTIRPPENKNKTISKFYLKNEKLTQIKNTIHLGLPIGTPKFIKIYWKEK